MSTPKLIVMNKERARRYSYQRHAQTSVIISIRDNNEEIIHFYRGASNGIMAICHTAFDDVEAGASQYQPITQNDAAVIAEFVEKWWDKVDTVIVHCGAGISRSAGCAAAIAKFFTGDDSFIFGDPKYHPNMTVYRAVYTQLMHNQAVREESTPDGNGE